MLITAASDVALLVNSGSDAVIHDVAFGSDELALELGEKLRGRAWIDTVTPESRAKVQALLNDAAVNAPRWRQINHPLVQGADLPILYTAVQLNGNGGIVVVGRSLRPMAKLQQQLVEAQQSMDREYLRLRQAETRHRLLFQLSSEAVLIVDATSQKIADANPVAQRMLAEGSKRRLGRSMLEGFDAASRQAVESLLGAVLATGRAQEVPARSVGDKARDFFVSASLFREGRASFFLVRLVPVQADKTAGASVQHSRVLEVVEAAPDGFVVTDLVGRIQFANRAFLDCVQLATAEQLRDQPIERWLGRSGVDYSVLAAQLAVPEQDGMAALRSKSLALADLFIRLVEARCAGHGLVLETPREHARRGSQVSLSHPVGAYAIMQALIARGVIGDFRAGDGDQIPDILRFGLTPLYLGFVDIWQAVEQLRQVLVSEEWQQPRFNQRQMVT